METTPFELAESGSTTADRRFSEFVKSSIAHKLTAVTRQFQVDERQLHDSYK